MRICIVNPFYDAASETRLEVTGRYRHLDALADALSHRNHEVLVVQALGEDRLERRGSVQFSNVRSPHRSAERLSGGPFGIDLLSRGNLRGILDAMEVFSPDAVHMNGLTLLQPLASISAWCAKKDRPFTTSHHGGEPRRAPWLRSAHRRALSSCGGAFFTTEAHAEPWLAVGVLRREQVVTCMEVSSTFAPADRVSARARTQMHGTPVFVWNAGLHHRKDPLTALKGFSLIRRRWAEARLYMIYVSAEMLSEVERTIAADPYLASSVEMRGFIPPAAVEDFLNSADFILQSSLREFSGYSILEAMACGVIPVVTDIPSFRVMTDEGRLGILFPRGDHQSMARHLVQFDLAQLAPFSRAVHDHFVRSLSYEAIAAIYERALQGQSDRRR